MTKSMRSDADQNLSGLPRPVPSWIQRLIAFCTGDGKEDDPGLDYGFLQLAIGIVAAVLPLVIVVFKWAHQHTWNLEGSISHYYYTAGRNWFVGSLCALAVFFLSYHRRATGKYRLDNIVSNFASAMAVGVAFCPTTFGDSTATSAEKVVGTIHLTCASLLFAALGLFALVLFRRSAAAATARKKQRNIVYKACGSVIFVCIALVALSEFLHAPSWWPKLYWFETVMVEAFAVSWLIKGGFLGILADPATPQLDRASGRLD